MNHEPPLTWREQMARKAQEALEQYRERARNPAPAEPLPTPFQVGGMLRHQAD